MWAVFAKSFQTQLTAVLGYDAATAKQITKTAKPKYKEIIAKLPEFEKADRFQLNIIGCAAYSCFAAADTDPHFMMATRYRSSVIFMNPSTLFAVVTVL